MLLLPRSFDKLSTISLRRGPHPLFCLRLFREQGRSRAVFFSKCNGPLKKSGRSPFGVDRGSLPPGYPDTKTKSLYHTRNRETIHGTRVKRRNPERPATGIL